MKDKDIESDRLKGKYLASNLADGETIHSERTWRPLKRAQPDTSVTPSSLCQELPIRKRLLLAI